MLAVIVIGIASLPAAFNVVMAWKSITPPAKQPLSDSAKSSLVGLAIIAAINRGVHLARHERNALKGEELTQGQSSAHGDCDEEHASVVAV